MSLTRHTIIAVAFAAFASLSAVGATKQTLPADRAPYHATFAYTNAGWMVYLQLFVPTREIFVSLDGDDHFRSTGFSQTIDPETRLPEPNSTIALPIVTPIDVRLETVAGKTLGPFRIEFDPLTELQKIQRQYLEQLKGSWVATSTRAVDQEDRVYNDIVYTLLVTYRCGIREVRYGFDSDVLDQRLALPPCDPEDPIRIPGDAETYLRLKNTYQWIGVQLVYADGTESEIMRWTSGGNRYRPQTEKVEK